MCMRMNNPRIFLALVSPRCHTRALVDKTKPPTSKINIRTKSKINYRQVKLCMFSRIDDGPVRILCV